MIAALLSLALAGPLDDQPGRSETRVYSAPYVLAAERSLDQMRLEERLRRLDYERVKGRPDAPGQYFYGDEVVWIYRRAFRQGGRQHAAELLGLQLENGQIAEVADGRGNTRPLSYDALEPELLAESLTESRARRRLVELADLPDHVWQPVLALEDHRFFDHIGVDGISIARALLENVRGGSVSQGGSTITQQLVKNRDLSPKRTLDRKASEALRALAIEAEYDKEEILGAYLNTVYYGHVDGVAVYGIGSAARTYFSKEAADLTLEEAAALAAVLQGPNGLHPIRHPDACTERRDRALQRMEELGWLSQTEARIARGRPLSTRKSSPEPEASRSLLAAIDAEVQAAAPKRAGLGVVVETHLDPLAQERAEEALATRLGDFDGVQGAVVLLEASTGEIVAYVGGDPRRPDAFDRAGAASRQPGSTAKPFALLEAVERCGTSGPLHLQSWVADSPFRLDTDAGTWEPDNYDHRDHGPTRLRDALVYSYNRPFARVGQHCTSEAIAERMTWAGLQMPATAPHSVVLGTVETSPRALAGAYTVFEDGRAREPVLIARIEKPAGGVLAKNEGETRRAASATGATLVRSAMTDVVDRGTATRADAKGVRVHGKTGSTTADAWFAGQADGLVGVVWLGRDDAKRLGITGGKGAAPVMATLAPLALAWPEPERSSPLMLVTREVDPETGLRVGALGKGEDELFRRGVTPPVKPLLGKGRPKVLE